MLGDISQVGVRYDSDSLYALVTISNEAKLVDHCPKTPPSRERRGSMMRPGCTRCLPAGDFPRRWLAHRRLRSLRRAGCIGAAVLVAPGGDGRWRSTRLVWFSSTATNWPPNSFSCHGLPTVGRPSFRVAAALRDNWVPASVQNPRSHYVNARTARSRQLPVEVR